jgi:hypothetical protein
MIIITVSFVTLFVNWYANRLLPLSRQFFLIPNKINEFVQTVIFHLLLESFCQNLITTWLLILFNFAIAV